LIPNIGINSIWWTTALTWVISSLFCLLRYTRWKRKAYRTQSDPV